MYSNCKQLTFDRIRVIFTYFFRLKFFLQWTFTVNIHLSNVTQNSDRIKYPFVGGQQDNVSLTCMKVTVSNSSCMVKFIADKLICPVISIFVFHHYDKIISYKIAVKDFSLLSAYIFHVNVQ